MKALTAKELYRRDQQYVVDEGKVVIVDEFTGRLMPDREWRDGLHQAVEAKEQIEVTPPKETYARISFQRFFRMYGKLAGMTGTAQEATARVLADLPSAGGRDSRPTARASGSTCRIWCSPRGHASGSGSSRRSSACTRRAGRSWSARGACAASEALSRLLTEQGLEHRVLNAVHHREEAQIVAQAGQQGWITVATNMAGRGTDIKLGCGHRRRSAACT